MLKGSMQKQRAYPDWFYLLREAILQEEEPKITISDVSPSDESHAPKHRFLGSSSQATNRGQA